MAEIPVEFRPLTRGMRVLLYSAAALVFGAGVPLLVFTECTDKFFAWTVQPPLTAAFLGACYWSAGVLEFTAARERMWARARVAVPGVVLFTALTGVLTAINFRGFNLAHPAAQVWIAVYFLAPPVLALIWWHQARARGGNEPRSVPMPGLMVLGYGVLGILLVGYGAVISLAPGLIPGGWPWELNPPEGTYAHLARMEPYVGVWLVGLGAVATHAALEGDLARVRCVLHGGVVFPVLTGVALARYPGLVRWGTPAASTFLGGLAFLLLLSLAGLAGLRRRGRTSLIPG